ncbi:sodium-dependent bicarbonate transport family permease [Aureimonas sp. SK2]|uniref:sodium-dependent bicarbonate transport family permease n=1 Tax=Aureimonas sp. SK2 TaxID=3015992 RepID=UPI0024445E6A|nr:sodium-dependent bicarbonate transport family permease [Aureimonas sp. SK2]
MLDLAASNLLSPAILCFVLGAVAVALRSDLRLPEPVVAALSIYLMLAIGMKGGVELSGQSPAELATPIAAALFLGCAIPLWCYALLRRFAGLGVSDAAAMAAHYGSVSAVTFAAATALLNQQGIAYEGYAAALLAIMEIPAIVVAIGLAGVSTLASASYAGPNGAAVLGGQAGLSVGPRLAGVVSDAFASKSVLLLAGGLVIGILIGPTGLAKVKPLFVDLFPGLLCLFLLELGRLAAAKFDEFRQVGARLAVFAIVMPVLHAAVGIALAHAAGLSEGGAIILGVLAGSASYIAAPAAVRLALPDANPGYYLTCSLAITFPFNIVVGLPLYAAMARWLYG